MWTAVICIGLHWFALLAFNGVALACASLYWSHHCGIHIIVRFPLSNPVTLQEFLGSTNSVPFPTGSRADHELKLKLEIEPPLGEEHQN